MATPRTRGIREFLVYCACTLKKRDSPPDGDDLDILLAALVRDPAALGPAVATRGHTVDKRTGNYVVRPDSQKAQIGATFSVFAREAMQASVVATCVMRNALEQTSYRDRPISTLELSEVRRPGGPVKARSIDIGVLL